jgi:chromosome segregation ATPase
MDINLQNAYVEVLLTNFMEVVKQNLLFQAQLEVGKKSVNELNDVRRQLEDVSKRNVELQHHLENSSKENSDFKRIISETPQINPIKEEKNRLQTALNEMMRENKSLKDSNSTLTTSLVDLNRYVEEMEKVIPVSKLKKLKTVESNKVPEEENIVISPGGTF